MEKVFEQLVVHDDNGGSIPSPGTKILPINNGCVAQLVEAIDLGSVSWGFESLRI